MSDLGLSLGSAANTFLEGHTLYFGPQSTGVLTVTLTAQDSGAGVKQVSFPALFGTVSANDTHAPYQQDYAIQGSSVISGRFQLEAMDNVGNITSSETFTVTKDNAAPVVNIYAPSQPSLLFAVSWAGIDDLTGIFGYDVEYKLDAGSWTRWLTGTTETEAEFSGADGQSYTFRVRAVDRVGNISAWVESSSVTVQTVTKYYTFGGRRIAEQQGSNIYYLHGDNLGSVSLVTDSTGLVVSQSRYLPFGEVRWTGGAKATDISYTGQRADSFGLMDYRARFYSGKLGRFASPDSIIPQASQGTQAWDRYAGMNNNPVKYNDPFGQDVGCGGQDCSVAKPSKQQPNEDDGWCMNAGNERWCSGTVESNWEWAKWNFSALSYEVDRRIRSPQWWNDISVTLADGALATSSLGASMELGATGLGASAGPEGGLVGFIAGNSFFLVVLNPIEMSLSWGSTIATAISDYQSGQLSFSIDQARLIVTIPETTATSFTLSGIGSILTVGMADASIDKAGSNFAHNPQFGLYDFFGIEGSGINFGPFGFQFGNK